ncbi:MAG: CBS domain-containing protein [Proteobacteria bacterium]|nr:CBS domain-containing protein [Pseudomonadota bacterium]MBU2469877.1 CBS domain-containing protein [Pseudomonadota bacterium]MBU2516161.1 CBS domain-containing protein [Pseudomonadota bacterium]
MPQDDSASSLAPEILLAFLLDTPPFQELGRAGLETLLDKISTRHFAAGELILQAGQSQVTHLLVIYQGQVRLFLPGQDGSENLQDLRSPGETIGALGIFRESLSNLNAEATEDTLCLLIPREEFLRLTEKSARFAQYYLKYLSEHYVGKALSELRRPKAALSSEGSLYLFSAQVGDVVRRRPETITASQPIQDAAAQLTAGKVGALLVADEAGEVVGVVTDRDLRQVVADGLDHRRPVSAIMSSPVHTISFHTVCFDALLEMLRLKVHHLAIERRGKIEGIVGGHDLMVAQGSSPFYLLREILAAEQFDEIYDLSRRVPLVVRSLIYEGARPGNITRMITLLNDYLLERVLNLLQKEQGPPPVPYCWLLMGSEGRKEQTFRTDQDNGLLYADPKDPEEGRRAQEYFTAFTTQAIEHLVGCGFPRCPGDMMASNPLWRQPYAKWRELFDRWIHKPEPKEVLYATIFFDFRPGHGEFSLGERLRDHLTKEVRGQEVFLRLLAKDTLTTPSPLTMFRNFVVEKKGEHKNKIDLKTKGLVPFVDFARVLSLAHGIKETNTLERLQLLGEGGHLSAELTTEAVQAYEFQMQLRLMHQQRLDEEGLPPNNFLDPSELSDLERHTLKDAFAVTGELKAVLREQFRLNLG